MYRYILFFLCLAIYSNAQNVKVLDKVTLQAIPYATVKNSKNTSTQTNEKGQINFVGFSTGDSLFVTALGYQNAAFVWNGKTTETLKIYLSEKSYSMSEVVISANKFDEKRKDIPQQINVINAREMEFANQQNTADLLTTTGNAFVQKSQMGGGSPVLRGFEASRVLMVIDGVRMNNAIYRAGHLQNVMRVDNNMLDKTEVIFGPGSVMYGSDALGGVMHFYTKNPVLSTDSGKTNVGGNAYVRYSSANNEKTAHADVNVGFKKFGSLTSITFSDFGDMRMGAKRKSEYGTWGQRTFYVERINGIDSTITNSNPELQVGSAYQQYDVLQKFMFKQSEKVNHVLNFQYSATGDVPRTDRLTDVRGGKPRFAEWYYGPEKRMMVSYALNLTKGSFYDRGKVVLAYQDIEESRVTRQYRRDTKTSQIENVKVATINVDFSKKIKQHELRYGIDAAYNDVNSTAFTQNIVTGSEKPDATRYADGGANMAWGAAYFTHAWEISEKLILSEGIRFSTTQLNASFVDKTFFPFPYNDVKQSNNAVNGNIGLVFMPDNSWRFAIYGSSGFRSPNVDDLSKVFESSPGTLIVPNPTIKPEYTYTGDVSIGKTFAEKVSMEIVGYYTHVNNLMSVKPFTLNGASTIDFAGVTSNVVAMQNTEKAFVTGASYNLSAEVAKGWFINGAYTFTYGRLKTDTVNYPLDHIPPMFGKLGLTYKTKQLRIEAFTLFNGGKYSPDYNLFGEDNQVYSLNPVKGYSPAWYTINMRAAYQFTSLLQVQLALENIMDTYYRQFASGFSASGRNISATLRVKF
ncbi:MAG: TonB-dependent receptor [Bacteroidota bacterium]